MRSPLRIAPGARLLALGVLLSVLGAAPGCSIVEEIDNIGKDPKAAAKAAEEETADPTLPAVPDGSNQAKLRAYYNRKAKKVEEDPNNPIVTCRISGATHFMRKHDCTLRGGSVS